MPSDQQPSLWRPMPTDEEITEAYQWGQMHAEQTARRPDELTEKARDAATDSLLWARRNYSGNRGTWTAFFRSAARVFVRRAIAQWTRKHHDRPEVGSLPETLPGRDLPVAGAVPMTSVLADLPEELRDAVRFYCIDGFDLRECALLLGIGHETVRLRLIRAAKLLEPEGRRPARRNGEKRLGRG